MFPKQLTPVREGNGSEIPAFEPQEIEGHERKVAPAGRDVLKESELSLPGASKAASLSRMDRLGRMTLARRQSPEAFSRRAIRKWLPRRD